VARSDLSFYVEQSTRKCKWESYEGRDEYCDTIKANQVIGRKLGVDFSSSTSSLSNTYRRCIRKQEKGGLLHPVHPGTNEWYEQEHKRRLAAKKKAEEEREREAKKVWMQVMKGLVVGLPMLSSECFEYLFVLVSCFYSYSRY
jgi:hypothetical protein